MFDLFRSFLPRLNPIGFGASDYVEFALIALLLCALVAWRYWIAHARTFAARAGWCMLLTGALPVALRLLLLPHYPIPKPGVADDFSNLLEADTLLHFRLANPSHPLHQFFETLFVLQQPTYASMLPPGQAIALAIGRVFLGSAWAGVALSIAVFCALCYWMLRAWTTPGWALVGGLLAGIEFGPLNQWMNSFWGGGVSAAAGCLVFGSLPRLRESGRGRDAALLGLGVALQWLTRPYECIFLVVAAALYFAPCWRKWRGVARTMLIAAGVVAPAFAVTLLQNRAVTGNWTTLPYQLSRYEYGIPSTFTFQPNPVPHRELTAEQRLAYDVQCEVHGSGGETVGSYVERLGARVRFYRFFFLPPLYIALAAFIPALREWRFAWVAATLALFALGTNFYPYFFTHYIAAAACLFVLMSVVGLERLGRWRVRGHAAGEEASRLLIFLCAAHFLFWYGLHVLNNDRISNAMWRYETWDAINQGDPEGRIAVDARLARAPGKQLVFVRYGPLQSLRGVGL